MRIFGPLPWRRTKRRRMRRHYGRRWIGQKFGRSMSSFILREQNDEEVRSSKKMRSDSILHVLRES
jgi:hypothetical protein